jgi:histone H3/H4
MADEQNDVDVAPEEATTENAVEEDETSPFPRARVVRLMRDEIKNKIIRSEVKEAMNMWLGDLTKKVAKEMGATQYASVSLADFQRATKAYDMIEDIVKDEQRLLLTVQKLREDSDHIIRELSRFFTVLRGRKQEENPQP